MVQRYLWGRDINKYIKKSFGVSDMRRHCYTPEHFFPSVVLPVEQRLVVEELGAGAVDHLLAEGLVLQELEKVQAQRVLDEPDVGGLLPVLQRAVKRIRSGNSAEFTIQSRQSLLHTTRPQYMPAGRTGS